MNSSPNGTNCRWILAGLTALAVALQLAEVSTRGIDPDEFEHLHVGYCVFRGDVPYRDFFEHHGPLLPVLIQPIFWLTGTELPTLWTLRACMLACSCGMLGLVYRLANQLGAPVAGMIATCLLAWTTIFHAKGLELRPDVPAALCLMGALAFCFDLIRATPAQRKPAQWAGLALAAGLATLFTQKSIVPLAGLTGGLALVQFRNGERGWWLGGLAIGSGVALAWGSAWICFASVGAGDDFLRSAVWQLWTWPIRSERWEQFRPTLSGDLTVWSLATLAAVSGTLTLTRKSFGAKELQPNTPRQQRLLLSLATLWCLASLLWVKAIYAQFYYLWMPWLAILAGHVLASVASLVPNSRLWRGAGLVALITGLAELGLWGSAWRAGTAGALGNLYARPVMWWGLTGLLGSLVVAVGIFAVRRRWGWFLGSLAALGCWYGVARNIELALWSNHEQVAGVNAVNRIVGPDETVFDGFTGYGCLRRHAFYYWWLNTYSLPLLPEEVRNSLETVLSRDPPAVVLFDDYLHRLPPRFGDWVEQNYRPVQPAPIRVLRQPASAPKR